MFASKLLTMEDMEPGGVMATLRANWPRYEPFIPPTETAKGATVVLVDGSIVPAQPIAVVNHGRWIVHCPYCTGAQFACASDTRFFCIECFHAEDPAAMGKWLTVRWASRDTIAAVTEALLKRPRMENRNWQAPHVSNHHARPGEPIVGLRGENAAFVTDHLVGQVFGE